METTIVYWGYVGITERKMETTKISWGYVKRSELLATGLEQFISQHDKKTAAEAMRAPT